MTSPKTRDWLIGRITSHPTKNRIGKAILRMRSLLLEMPVDTFNDPELALSSFKPGLYDLVLLDFRMPKMYGHELYDEMKKIDSKIKVCFMTASYMNYEALRDAFPSIEIECYIQKPVKTQDLIRKINAELEHK